MNGKEDGLTPSSAGKPYSVIRDSLPHHNSLKPIIKEHHLVLHPYKHPHLNHLWISENKKMIYPFN